MADDVANSLPQLPEPPPLKRRIRLHTFQWILVPIAFLGPVILAVSGALGETRASVSAENSSFSVAVQYPARLRFRQPSAIEITLESRATGGLDTLTISLDTVYASQFSDVRGIPQLERPYSLKLAAARPGERLHALIEFYAESAGVHTGNLVVTAQDTVRVRLRTIVFP
jgi:hypothetical protein